MKKNSLPDYREKQRLLYGGHTTAEELITYGRLFWERDRFFDALEFYKKAGYIDGLKELKERAKGMGDAMLFAEVLKALGENPSTEEWSTLARQAKELKKYQFALWAAQKGKDERVAQDVRKIMESEGEMISQ